ncbi:unnamed protein product [Nezara viridula]|uniref:Uncharacterized protein n=1 Tax=Nezara viridula TaxID=85310 RepID=A0A9P0HAK6_NEZVI|nr:unnamed protein product [Nezara viridula]
MGRGSGQLWATSCAIAQLRPAPPFSIGIRFTSYFFKVAEIIDIAVSNDGNINSVCAEKIRKYQGLAAELKSLYKLNKVTVRGIVISSNGLVPVSTVEATDRLGLPTHVIKEAQKAVLLNTARIVALLALFACANAGYLGGYAAAPALSYGASYGYGAGYGYAAPAVATVAHAPAISYAAPAVATVAHAPVAVAHAPVATSYSNTYRTVNKPVAVAAPALSYAAPAVSYAAPAVSYAAPAVSYAAPAVATVAHAPAVSYAAPVAAVAHAPVATSYANTYRTVNKPVAVAAPAISYAAPAVATVAHAPAVSYAAPAVSYAAPAVATVAHAPVSYGLGYRSSYGLGYGYGLGYSSLLHH